MNGLRLPKRCRVRQRISQPLRCRLHRIDFVIVYGQPPAWELLGSRQSFAANNVGRAVFDDPARSMHRERNELKMPTLSKGRGYRWADKSSMQVLAARWPVMRESTDRRLVSSLRAGVVRIWGEQTYHDRNS